MQQRCVCVLVVLSFNRRRALDGLDSIPTASVSRTDRQTDTYCARTAGAVYQRPAPLPPRPSVCLLQQSRDSAPSFSLAVHGIYALEQTGPEK